MQDAADGGARRYGPVRDLTPFELAPLLGDGATLEDLRHMAERLANSFALERHDEGDRWQVVGCTAGEDRARVWVRFGGEPERHGVCKA